MTEFSIEFSEKLIEAANVIAKDDLDPIEAKRTVLYLSLLSCEISLKALLEAAGMPVRDIKRRSHRLSKLLADMSSCEIYKEVTPGTHRWIRATEIRSLTIDNRFSNGTVGALLTAEGNGASIYPNQIRYGATVRHFPPKIMLEVAKSITDWAKLNIGNIRLVTST